MTIWIVEMKNNGMGIGTRSVVVEGIHDLKGVIDHIDKHWYPLDGCDELRISMVGDISRITE